MNDTPKKRGARDLFLQTLKDAGVTPKVDEKGRLSFYYGKDEHSEIIDVEANNDCALITLYDANWYEVSRWDVETVNELQQRINKANFGSRAKIVYYFDDDDTMNLSSIITFPFTEDMKDRACLLDAELTCLAETHRIIADIKKVENVKEGSKE